LVFIKARSAISLLPAPSTSFPGAEDNATERAEIKGLRELRRADPVPEITCPNSHFALPPTNCRSVAAGRASGKSWLAATRSVLHAHYELLCHFFLTLVRSFAAP